MRTQAIFSQSKSMVSPEQNTCTWTSVSSQVNFNCFPSLSSTCPLPAAARINLTITLGFPSQGAPNSWDHICYHLVSAYPLQRPATAFSTVTVSPPTTDCHKSPDSVASRSTLLADIVPRPSIYLSKSTRAVASWSASIANEPQVSTAPPNRRGAVSSNKYHETAETRGLFASALSVHNSVLLRSTISGVASFKVVLKLPQQAQPLGQYRTDKNCGKSPKRPQGLNCECECFDEQPKLRR